MLQDKILNLKKELGDSLCIMGHHYQNDIVMQYVDKAGDSLELARAMENISAKDIVFCGVHFMAETATLLAKDGQYVHIPDESAGCLMADMVPAELLEKVLTTLNSGKRKVIPVAYVNTSLATKHVVGKFGGVVCTSANAKSILKWALEEAQKDNEYGSVLFLPDANLAENAADLLGITKDKVKKLSMNKEGELFNNDENIKGEVLTWPGCCPIHERLTVKDMEKTRADYPTAKIVLHPECAPALVEMADYAGSTSYIIKLAEELPEGSILLVGTEVNLVDRLAKKYDGQKTIRSLKPIACPDMAKITEEKLYEKLLEIKENRAKAFEIDTNLSENAIHSLTRMFNAC